MDYHYVTVDHDFRGVCCHLLGPQIAHSGPRGRGFPADQDPVAAPFPGPDASVWRAESQWQRPDPSGICQSDSETRHSIALEEINLKPFGTNTIRASVSPFMPSEPTPSVGALVNRLLNAWLDGVGSERFFHKIHQT